MSRDSWDQYFLNIAMVVSSRSTCNRKRVGCVLVVDHIIISTGYGGSLMGLPHCSEVGCDLGPEGGCVRTIHAEQNAIALAARHGSRVFGATAYVTLSPCYTCFKLLVNSGVKRILYAEEYRIPPRFDLAIQCGVEMGQFIE